MIKVVEDDNRNYYDRECWAANVNYWVAKGYKVINTFTKDNKIVAVLDNGKVK